MSLRKGAFGKNYLTGVTILPPAQRASGSERKSWPCRRYFLLNHTAYPVSKRLINTETGIKPVLNNKWACLGSAPSQNNPFAFLKSILQPDLKNLPVIIGSKYFLAFDPPDNHMMHCAGRIYSRFPWQNEYIMSPLFATILVNRLKASMARGFLLTVSCKIIKLSI